jgi:hypothetical protein
MLAAASVRCQRAAVVISQTLSGAQAPAGHFQRPLGAVNGQDNFGTINVDWPAGEITLAVRGLDGRAVRSVTIPIARLAG